MITAIYPGTYDPVTNGHVDVIRRAAEIFDRVVVGVVGSPAHKQPMFKVEERVELLEDALSDIGNVEVDVFKELVVDDSFGEDAEVISPKFVQDDVNQIIRKLYAGLPGALANEL